MLAHVGKVHARSVLARICGPKDSLGISTRLPRVGDVIGVSHPHTGRMNALKPGPAADCCCRIRAVWEVDSSRDAVRTNSGVRDAVPCRLPPTNEAVLLRAANAAIVPAHFRYVASAAALPSCTRSISGLVERIAMPGGGQLNCGCSRLIAGALQLCEFDCRRECEQCCTHDDQVLSNTPGLLPC